MMGNETSHLKSLHVEDKSVETTDFWSHHHATIGDSCNFFSLKSDGSVSLFKGKPVLGPLWTVSTPLEKFTNNLLKYRHPCIVRYISSWQQKSTFHLVTEYVQPLAQVISSQTPLQICIGLNNILQALVFLHEQGGTSHNNVSISSIYVSGDGQWKLGGLQYLCMFSELNSAYLKHARIHRYDKAVDPNEGSYELTSKVDHYGFAVLVEDVFKGRGDGDVPHLIEFKKCCRDHLQNVDPNKRPDLSEILKHDFFNHEFISIYKFLINLPLKTEEEKCSFFSSILNNLKNYDEETVAKQLGGLLLSRHSLLDQTARKNVIPFILKPKNERLHSGEQTGYFSSSVFKEHVKPRLLQLFGVRDSQIRTLILSHFTKFVHMFSQEELSKQILPELLLGIKDVDDNLVATTLMCLSDLVPILGADTVVGGKRTKIFIDGRPHTKTNLISSISNKSLEELNSPEVLFQHDPRNQNLVQTIVLNERPSPVGGESIDNDDLTVETNINNDSEDDWDDWDSSKRNLEKERAEIGKGKNMNSSEFPINSFNNITETVIEHDSPLIRSTLLQKAAIDAKRNIIDISELDIKNRKMELLKKNDEIDFFADMAPVIEKQEVAVVEINKSIDYSSKLNFVPDENLAESEGWGDNWND